MEFDFTNHQFFGQKFQRKKTDFLFFYKILISNFDNARLKTDENRR